MCFLVVSEHGLKTVQEYMYHIRTNAENSVRNLLVEVARRAGRNVLQSEDYLDDGTPVRHHFTFRFLWGVLILDQIRLRVDINEQTRSAVLDFEGTGCEVRGNLNAPISVVHSAVIYCMRAMLEVDIPLNAGCLVPLDGAYIHIADGAGADAPGDQCESPRNRCCRRLGRPLFAAAMCSRLSASSTWCSRLSVRVLRARAVQSECASWDGTFQWLMVVAISRLAREAKRATGRPLRGGAIMRQDGR